eukprot:2553375-Rhodomonas_salina.2
MQPASFSSSTSICEAPFGTRPGDALVTGARSRMEPRLIAPHNPPQSRHKVANASDTKHCAVKYKRPHR